MKTNKIENFWYDIWMYVKQHIFIKWKNRKSVFIKIWKSPILDNKEGGIMWCEHRLFCIRFVIKSDRHLLPISIWPVLWAFYFAGLAQMARNLLFSNQECNLSSKSGFIRKGIYISLLQCEQCPSLGDMTCIFLQNENENENRNLYVYVQVTR